MPSRPFSPIGFHDQNVVVQALPADLAFIAVFAPARWLNQTGQPTADCDELCRAADNLKPGLVLKHVTSAIAS